MMHARRCVKPREAPAGPAEGAGSPEEVRAAEDITRAVVIGKGVGKAAG
jgi:hypothetical protein